jgi:hypothetical protein
MWWMQMCVAIHAIELESTMILASLLALWLLNKAFIWKFGNNFNGPHHKLLPLANTQQNNDKFIGSIRTFLFMGLVESYFPF